MKVERGKSWWRNAEERVGIGKPGRAVWRACMQLCDTYPDQSNFYCALKLLPPRELPQMLHAIWPTGSLLLLLFLISSLYSTSSNQTEAIKPPLPSPKGAPQPYLPPRPCYPSRPPRARRCPASCPRPRGRIPAGLGGGRGIIGVRRRGRSALAKERRG